MDDDDFGNNIIRASMLHNRYVAITSNLSFAPRGTRCGWAKISWLDGVIRVTCRDAVGITQHMAIDESMIKVLSKFCPWIQYMPKKPIKRGNFTHHHSFTVVNIRVYVLNNRNQGLLLSSGDWIPL